MAETKREISGFFLSSDKFASHVAALAAPECSTTHLRLFHNDPHHTAAVLQALSANVSVTSLDLFELDPAAAASLAAFLAASPRLTSLAIHHAHDSETVRRLAEGLARNRNLTDLHFSQLNAAGVQAIAAAVAAWPFTAAGDKDIPVASARQGAGEPDSRMAIADIGKEDWRGRTQDSRGGCGGANDLESSLSCGPQDSAAAAAATAFGAQAARTPTAGEPLVAHGEPGPRLQRLRLEKCSVTVEAATALAEAFGRQAGALARLEVVESDFGDAASEALVRAPGWRRVEAAGTLRCLDLTSCHVGVRGAAQLGSFLAATCSLQTLVLARNKALGCAGATALAEGLSRNQSLLRLDLSECGVGPVGVTALANALRCSPAGELPAPGTGHAATEASGVRGIGAAANELAGAACHPHAFLLPLPLQHLVLSGNAAGSAGFRALLESLAGAAPCELRTLLLDHNHIRGAELAQQSSTTAALTPPAPALSSGLPPVTAPLEQLSLAGNALYDIGVGLLSASLAAAPSLAQLDLRENGISDAGVAALLPLIVGAAAASAAAPGGAAERKGGRHRSSAGGAAAGGVVGAPGLQGLVLDGNRLHNAGAQALLEAVTAAPWLWRFSAEGNKLTDPALRLSLTQLSQLRAARHSQLVVLGRQYSSSSSSSDETGRRDSNAGGRSGGGGRGSGGGAGGHGTGGGGGDSRRSSGEERRGGNGGGSGGGAAPMDTECPQAGGGYAGCTLSLDPAQPQSRQEQQQRQQAQPSVHPQHKHRLDDGLQEGTGSSSGDEGQPARHVAFRCARLPSTVEEAAAAESETAQRTGPGHCSVAATGSSPAAAPMVVDAAPGRPNGGCEDHRVLAAASSLPNAAAAAAALGPAEQGLRAGADPDAWRLLPNARALPGTAGGLGGSCGLPFPRTRMAPSGRIPCAGASARCSSADGEGFVSGSTSGTNTTTTPTSSVGGDAFMADTKITAPVDFWCSTPASAAAAGAAGHLFASSPPLAMCFITAVTGAGAGAGVAGSRSDAKRVSGAGGLDGGRHEGLASPPLAARKAPLAGGAGGCEAPPQQILPACRRPRYKPLTPEQQRLFEDF